MLCRSALLALLVAGLLAAGCGDDPYSDSSLDSGSTGEVTGILLNVQRPDTPDTNAVAAGTTTSWSVVDPSGQVIFSSKDIGKQTMYEFRREEALGRRTQLGRNHREFGIIDFEVKEGEGDTRTMTFTVSDVTASEMRSIPNFMQLIGGYQLVVLSGKSGS